jgi:Mg2+ and Co2+ transporter CorA
LHPLAVEDALHADQRPKLELYFMPELNVRFGYFAVLAATLTISLYLFYRFRKAGWIWPRTYRPARPSFLRGA